MQSSDSWGSMLMNQARAAAAKAGHRRQRHGKTQGQRGGGVGGGSVGLKNTLCSPDGLRLVAGGKGDEARRLVPGPEPDFDPGHLPARREHGEACNNR